MIVKLIKIEDFILKNLEQGDLEIIFSWRNSERIRSVMNHDELITINQHTKWFKSVIDDPTKLAKLLLYKNKPIGFIQFTNMNTFHGTCEWGFYVGENTAPPSSGTIMGILALDYLFNELNMRKLSAFILDFNRISINYHKKLGFIEEGRLIKHIQKNNQFNDLIVMGLFKDNWMKSSELLKKEVMSKIEGDHHRS